MVWSIEDKLTR